MTTDGHPVFSGAILVGGASRRMGRDKAMVCIEGRPLASHIAAALRGAGATEVFVVGGDRERFAALGIAWRPDLWPGEGPLGGVITALEQAANDTVLIAATDLIGLAPEDVVPLINACRPDHPVVLPLGGARPAVLQGAYHRSATALLRAAFDAGERSVVRAVQGLPVMYCSTARAVPDVDTPEELDLYIQSRAR